MAEVTKVKQTVSLGRDSVKYCQTAKFYSVLVFTLKRFDEIGHQVGQGFTDWGVFRAGFTIEVAVK